MRVLRRSHTSGPRVPWPSSSVSTHQPHPTTRSHPPHVSHPQCIPPTIPSLPLCTAHRYVTNGGQSELCKGVGGPNKKLFYQGWASFLRMAIRHNGMLTLTFLSLTLSHHSPSL